MKRLRALTLVAVVNAATLGTGLLAILFGTQDQVAHGQTVLAPGPSMLAAPTGYAAAPGYSSLPSHYSPPTYYDYAAAPTYNAAPAYAPLPTPYSYAHTAYPASAYPSTSAQAAPYRYQAAEVRNSWPYAQTNVGPTNMLLGPGDLPGGPLMAPMQVQLPAPSPAATYNQPPAAAYGQSPLQQAPHPAPQGPKDPMQTQMVPNYTSPGYAMPDYPGGAAACDASMSCSVSNYGPPVVRNWFFSLSGLTMTRDHGDHFAFSYGTGNEADQRTNTRDADMNWAGGFDIRFGKYFNCQRNAIEAVYWGIFPECQSTQTVSADVLGDLNGIFNWDSLNYGPGSANLFVNVAPGDDGIHMLSRHYAFQNVELNLWRFCGECEGGACNCSRLRTNWLLGIRYFRFDEELLFVADANDEYITYEDDEIFYNVNIENHLVGFQIGNELQYGVCDRLTADLGIKLGVYGNQINHISEIGGNYGVATINNGPFNGTEFYVNNSKNDVAFLGEINLALRYCFNHRWTGTIGYRALAVTGVAMPADQIYPDLRGINDVENIDSSRGLILHGGFAGLEFNW